jgi:hypothetical protein
MEKVDKCPYCESSEPHQGPTGCKPVDKEPMLTVPVITVEDVKAAYAGWNGDEAADEAYLACPEAFEETAKYLEDYEYDKDDEGYLNCLGTTLDVLRKAYGGDFKNLHADGNGQFEYCNAAETHVATNPLHKVVTEYVGEGQDSRIEVRCETDKTTALDGTVTHCF